MDEPKSLDMQATQSIAERLLTETFGGPIHLANGETLADRSHVFRFQTASAPADTPSSFIVKRARVEAMFNIDAADRDGILALLFNDMAGLQFLGQVMGENSIVPRFYGCDRDAALFVMQDLGTGSNPADALLEGTASEAESGLMAMMTGLGQMHAASTGKEDIYRDVRSKAGAYVPGQHKWNIANLRAFADAVELPLTEAVEREMDHVSTSMNEPGAFLAYTHGDPCPDNWLKAGDKLWLYDFEMGSFRHALLDGIYPHILFPSCWCMNRLPADLVQHLDSVYRAELVKGCAEAADDRLYYPVLVDAAACMTLITCSWVPDNLMETDTPWGLATLRQRILTRCPLFHAIAHRHQHREVLADFLLELSQRLGARWSDTEALPLYPAFRG